MTSPDRNLSRQAVRRIKRQVWAEKRASASFLRTCQDDVAAGWERSALARRVGALLAPITVPVDEVEALRCIRLQTLAIRLTGARHELAHRRKVVRELALLASDPRWEASSRPARALLTLAVRWGGQTAAQAWAGLPRPTEALENAA